MDTYLMEFLNIIASLNLIVLLYVLAFSFYIAVGIGLHLCYYAFEKDYKEHLSPAGKFFEIILWPLGVLLFVLIKPFGLISTIIKNAEKEIDKGRKKC